MLNTTSVSTYNKNHFTHSRVILPFQPILLRHQRLTAIPFPTSKTSSHSFSSIENNQNFISPISSNNSSSLNLAITVAFSFTLALTIFFSFETRPCTTPLPVLTLRPPLPRRPTPPDLPAFFFSFSFFFSGRYPFLIASKTTRSRSSLPTTTHPISLDTQAGTVTLSPWPPSPSVFSWHSLHRKVLRRSAFGF
jgi:hypothetical protein